MSKRSNHPSQPHNAGAGSGDENMSVPLATQTLAITGSLLTVETMRCATWAGLRREFLPLDRVTER